MDYATSTRSTVVPTGSGVNTTGPMILNRTYLYVGMTRVGPYLPGLIRCCSETDGTWSDIAGSGDPRRKDGTGTDAWFSRITGLGHDGTNLWVADEGNAKITWPKLRTSPLSGGNPTL